MIVLNLRGKLKKTKEKIINKTTKIVKEEVGKSFSEQLIIYAPLICATVGLVMSHEQVKASPSMVHIETIHIERVYIKH